MKERCDFLLSWREPRVSAFAGECALLVAELQAWHEAHPEVQLFQLEGRRMRTIEGFYDELERVLGLPDYFGRNLNALAECLTDNDVLVGDEFVLLIRNGEAVLAESEPEALEGFVETLRSAADEWAQPVTLGEAWDRPAYPFHVLFLIERGAGARVLDDLPRFPIEALGQGEE